MGWSCLGFFELWFEWLRVYGLLNYTKLSLIVESVKFDSYLA